MKPLAEIVAEWEARIQKLSPQCRNPEMEWETRVRVVDLERLCQAFRVAQRMREAVHTADECGNLFCPFCMMDDDYPHSDDCPAAEWDRATGSK